MQIYYNFFFIIFKYNALHHTIHFIQKVYWFQISMLIPSLPLPIFAGSGTSETTVFGPGTCLCVGNSMSWATAALLMFLSHSVKASKNSLCVWETRSVKPMSSPALKKLFKGMKCWEYLVLTAVGFFKLRIRPAKSSVAELIRSSTVSEKAWTREGE